MRKIKVKLHPGSSQEKINKISENEFEVWIKEKPIDGKANLALEKFLKKELGFSYKVVRGFKSREKVLEYLGK
jgi:uncharacterized protein (TIGR00251 family)